MSRQTIINIAASQVGTKENPPGSRRTKYGEWYGENGVKWCAIFVSWVYNEAGYTMDHIDSAKGYASCQDGYNYWKKNGCLTTKPQMGDVVLYDWNEDGHCDHTGIFYQWIEEGKSFQTYEGNTSAGSENDGGTVMPKTRNMKYVEAFASPKVLQNSVKAQ